MVISALGFVACDSSDDDNGSDYPIEYGTPTADYKYMGTVTDKNGKPIEGIKATLVGYNSLTSSQKVAEFTTDKNGKFESEVYSETVATVKIIEFADVDGELNGGEFATTSITTSQMQTTKVKDGDGGWYRGEFRPILSSHPKRPTKRSWSRGEWGYIDRGKADKEEGRIRARERR